MPYLILQKKQTENKSEDTFLFNLKASIRIAEFIRSTLGPSSMNKVIVINKTETIITNDGATVLSHLDAWHPISKILVEISRSQDFEVGDGTTSVCLLAVELLISAKELMDENVHPSKIIKYYKKCGLILTQILNEIAENRNLNHRTNELLISCCATSLNSKLISGKRHLFSEMIVNICNYMGNDFDPSMISVKLVCGGSISDSFFIKGIVIKKPFSYAGFEKQLKKYFFPKILTLNLELELKLDKNNIESRIKDVETYQAIIDAEWSLIYEKLDKITKSGAKIVFSKLVIGDIATQYFTERGILCGGRIPSDDINRLSKSICARVIATSFDINQFSCGTCNLIEERQIGEERFLVISGCKNECASIIVRGASEYILEESKRCLNDGMMIVKKVIKNKSIVAGAGAIEMRLSSKLRKYANSLIGEEQLIISKYAKSLEVIPRTICENAGLDSMSLISNLRYAHNNSDNWNGIDIEKGKTFDAYSNYIWEPTVVKANYIQAATEAACTILSTDKIHAVGEKNHRVYNS